MITSSFQTNAIKFFDSVEYKIIDMDQDDFFLLVPKNKEELRKYGTACLSPEGMTRIGELLSKF
jgi:hypothetical protein